VKPFRNIMAEILITELSLQEAFYDINSYKEWLLIDYGFRCPQVFGIAKVPELLES